MAVDVTAAPTGARTGAQFLDGLRDDGREVWMDGERIDDIVGHPLLGGAAGGLDADGRTQLASLLRTLVTTIREGT